MSSSVIRRLVEHHSIRCGLAGPISFARDPRNDWWCNWDHVVMDGGGPQRLSGIADASPVLTLPVI